MRPHRHGPFPVHPRPPAGDGGFASQPPAPPPRAAPVGAGDGPGHIPTRSFLPALRSPPVPESRSPSPGWMSRPTPSLPAAPPTGMAGRSGERYAAPGDRPAVPARHRRHEPSGLRQGASPARMRAPDHHPGWAAATGSGIWGVLHPLAVGACPRTASRAAIGAAVT